MKIAHIATYPPRGIKHAETGGVSSYTKNLVTNMPAHKQDTMYVLCDKIDQRKIQYKEDGVTVLRIFDRDIRCFIQLWRAIKTISPDVLHIQQELNLFGGPATAYLLQWFVFFARRRAKIIITLHGIVDLSRVDAVFVKENNSSLPPFIVSFALRLIYMPLCRRAHHIIVHETFFRKLLIHQYTAEAGKISVIPHGIEILEPTHKAEARSILNISPASDVILYMGYLTGYKGLDLLIDGFAEYAKRAENAYLIIGAGKHPKLKDDEKYLAEYKRLENKAASLLPPEQYRWSGFIKEEEMPTYFGACDVSIYPYTIAMASSGPMSLSIGYNKPFLASDAFTNMFDQQIIFQKSPAALANKLANFFANPEAQGAYVRDLRDKRSWRREAEATIAAYGG